MDKSKSTGRYTRAFPSDLSLGMTLRDYFAAQVLPSMYSGPDDFRNTHEAEQCAVAAYRYADAMMAQRNKASQ
jgi:hypothetical protein